MFRHTQAIYCKNSIFGPIVAELDSISEYSALLVQARVQKQVAVVIALCASRRIGMRSNTILLEF